MTDYVAGTTIILQIIYYNASNVPIDADASPPVNVEIRDARNRKVQTDLAATKTATGTYQYQFKTTGLTTGLYYFVFSSCFGGYPDKKSSTFTLKDVL